LVVSFKIHTNGYSLKIDGLLDVGFPFVLELANDRAPADLSAELSTDLILEKGALERVTEDRVAAIEEI